jgi:hypothetical protein
MSIFVPVPIACPSCNEKSDYRVAHSINADRRPDLREEVLARTFQKETCPKCESVFRIPPEFTYFDGGRSQWILVQPAESLVDWRKWEKQAQATYDRTYGTHASTGAQAVGGELMVRTVFGWAGLREKLLCSEYRLDDIVLELLKTMLLRNSDAPPISDRVELRLVEVEKQELIFAWVDASTDGMYQVLDAPRSLYDDIAADQANWGTLPDDLSAGPFVDMQRLFVSAE